MSTRVLADDAAASAAQFDMGVKAMTAGDFEHGCPAIRESYRLDPRPGTLFTLAECEAKWGKVASAVAHYGDYLGLYAAMPRDRQTGQHGRNEIAAQQKAALSPRVPHLLVALPASAPPGTVVRRDDAELGAASLGIALPVDPGEHVVTTQAPGGPVP